MGFLTGISDHGLLSGLADDDHTQYVLRNVLTTDGDLFSRNAGAVTRIAAVATGQVFASAGTSTLPVWTASPTVAACTITAGTLAADASAFTVSATQPASPTTTQSAVKWTITSAGSAAVENYGLLLDYLAGYTGNQANAAMRVYNNVAGTNSADPLTGNVRAGNIGISVDVDTSADTRGVVTRAQAGTTRSIGFYGYAKAAAGGTSYGVLGGGEITGATTLAYGGYFFTLGTGATGSTALIADNRATTNDIFQAIDDTVNAFVIKDGGAVGINQGSPTISGTGKLHMTADTFRLDTARTPATAGAAGNAGDICWDASYIYVCTATNAWERAAIASW